MPRKSSASLSPPWITFTAPIGSGGHAASWESAHTQDTIWATVGDGRRFKALMMQTKRIRDSFYNKSTALINANIWLHLKGCFFYFLFILYMSYVALILLIIVLNGSTSTSSLRPMKAVKCLAKIQVHSWLTLKTCWWLSALSSLL